ncbi:unnamed protein product [Cunninghamella blakesleeana]
MLKSFILQPSIISNCLNIVAKRTIFNTRLVFEKQQKEITTTLDDPNSTKVVGRHGQRRIRRAWTEEEDKKLKHLINEYGLKYTQIAKMFPNQSVPVIYNCCRSLVKDSMKQGPWLKEELDALNQLTKSAGPHEDRIDWVTVQAKLPHLQSIPLIKLTWNNRINPRFRHGRWQPDETSKLRAALAASIGNLPQTGDQLNNVDWHKISDMVGTRTSHQCLEKVRWQELPETKGNFTPEEDQQLLDAVKTYGDSNFLLISQVMNSSRSPRSLSHRYRYGLDPNSDRSPWTVKEEMDVYHNLPKYNGSMVAVRTALNSKRHIRDMWNHYKKIVKRMNKEK